MRLAALFCLPLLLHAQGTEPKPKASDYPVHATVQKLGMGAEYLVHSFYGRKQTFFTSDYLVVEVAIYPAKGETLAISHGHFTLRMNGKKQAILPQAPAFVAASLKYPDWQQRPNLEVGAGPVVLGRPQQVERFPGDPRPRQTRLPNPPKAPEPEDPSGMDKEPTARAYDVAVESALPEIDATGPTSGFLYFAYKGKITSIKSLELLYAGPQGTAALKLQ